MHATLIYPHQLFAKHLAIEKDRTIYLVEEPLFFGEFPIHAQKLMLHRLSMKAYEKLLQEEGHEITYINANKYKTTQEVLQKIADDGVTTFHIADTTDMWLEKRITEFCTDKKIERINYESQLFVLSKKDAVVRYQSSKKFMHRFYQSMRKDMDILMEGDEPFGGKWSFDHDNRKKIPKGHVLPDDIELREDEEIKDAITWLDTLDVEMYGEKQFWLPYTREDALEWFDDFLEIRFDNFGAYEDAIHTEHARLYHSALSPLINIGLLHPQEVIDKAIEFASKHDTPLNSLEGFVRQILGWREFIRAAYEYGGTSMRSKNFFNAQNKLSEKWWTGETGVDPLDHAIQTSLKYGYAHHIERLMVLGNVMLLSHLHPDEVYKWFMAMYVDAYDWVMVPNVYGMSQFADGGSFATKPYIAGANYIHKMSDYQKGEWEATMTGLYWNFIDTHLDVFKKNHRMSMMPRLWEKMDTEKKDNHVREAKKLINTTTCS